MATGIFENGLYFNGNGTIYTGLTKGYSNWTISAWIMINSTSQRQNLIASAGAGNWGLYLVGPVLEVNDDNSLGCTDVVQGSTKLSTGTWYHVAGRRINGSETAVFLNGVKDGRIANPSCSGFAGSPMYIGSQSNSVNFYTGAMDEIIVSQEAYSDAYIKTLSQARNAQPSFNSDDQ